MAALIGSQLFGSEANKIMAQILPSNLIPTETNWFTTVLKLLRCSTTEPSSGILRLNNFFMRYTLLFAKGFSYIYIYAKACIIPIFIFYFATLWVAIFFDSVKWIILKTWLSKRFQSSAFIPSGFEPKGKCSFLLKKKSSIYIRNRHRLNHQTWWFSVSSLLDLPLFSKPNLRSDTSC